MRVFRLILWLAIVVLCASALNAQKAGLATDPQHGAIGANACLSCHTPHGGTNGVTLLWVHSVGSSTYTTYTSPTMGNATSNIVSPGNGNLVAGAPENNSLLCLSCHDGALAAANTVTLRTTTYGAVNGAVTGTAIDVAGGALTLSDDHPVNMSLDPANDAGLDTVANVTTAGLVLYSGGGATNTVQCGSCHDPHKVGPDNSGNPGGQYYLRLSNASSGLCLTCHL